MMKVHSSQAYCKLDTKEQVQWTQNWLADTRRTAILNDWSKLIKLKTNEPIFSADFTISPDGSNIRQRLYIYNNSNPTSQLRNVVVLANFSVGNQNINPNFPTDAYTYPMTWYNLMDNTPVTITSPTATIALAPGQFRVYGNKPSTLSSNEIELTKNNIDIFPNPTSNSFALSVDITQVEIYTITGQLIKLFSNVISNQQLDITNLETGMYLIKTTDINGTSQTKKLIKK